MPDGGVKMANDNNGLCFLGLPVQWGRQKNTRTITAQDPKGHTLVRGVAMGTNRKPLAGPGWSGKQHSSLDLSEGQVRN